MLYPDLVAMCLGAGDKGNDLESHRACSSLGEGGMAGCIAAVSTFSSYRWRLIRSRQALVICLTEILHSICAMLVNAGDGICSITDNKS